MKNQSYYKTNINSVKILKTRVDFISLVDAITLVGDWVKSNKQYQITTPNPEQIVFAYDNYRFNSILNRSHLAIADGIGLILAAKLLSFKKSFQAVKFQRLSGIDLMTALCRLAADKGWRVFLLGGKNGVVKKAAEQLVKDNKGFKLDYFSGSQNIAKETEVEKKQAIAKINQFKPDFLFVGFGAPYQEQWIDHNLAELKVKVAMSVGGSFDYLAGKVNRSPVLLRRIGLEWFWRLLNQPWRIQRQLALIRFIFLVLTSKS